MCGVFGVVSLDGRALVGARARLAAMGKALLHRGPDDMRILASPLCAIGAVRLAVIDLSSRAGQPLSGPDGSLWLACNGEIYNSAALRLRFPDHPYRTRGDLEPLLPLLAARGGRAPADIDGMFALAAWDGRREQLILARDRAGEKPLFLAEQDGALWFASEIGALLTLPGISREIDPVALSQHLRLGYTLEPRTLFAAIRRVEAGSVLIVRRGTLTVERYWDPGAAGGLVAATAHARVRQLRGLLQAAVRRQVVADVPLGVFTSGGLDSSLLAVLAARELGPERLTTFSARFTARSYDEGVWARRCAHLAGTRHVEVPCTEESLAEAFHALGETSAEPISDPAVLPTWLLARAARKEVRVVLTGEGADELFGGYPTYLGHRLAPGYRALPPPLRRAIEQGVARLPASERKVTLEFLLRCFVAGASLPGWVERHVEWFGAGVPEASARPRGCADSWFGPWLAQQHDRGSRAGRLPGPPAALSGAMLLDYCTCLREKLLVKSDRALMLHSVEGRMPFLDPQLTAFALGLPATDRVRMLSTKWLLKQAARPWLPDDLVHRRKRGLSVPVAALLNGALRTQCDTLLRAGGAAEPLFDLAAVRQMLEAHRAGHTHHARVLWSALTLAAWAARWQAMPPENLSAQPQALSGA